VSLPRALTWDIPFPQDFGHNKYATKKTITQGLLDIALLTANASQLKFVLEVGENHPYYTLLLTLLVVSIALQVSYAEVSRGWPVALSIRHGSLTRLSFLYCRGP
jgi:hypothetical protein